MAARRSQQQVDQHWARELALFIENDGTLYRQQYVPIALNYARKMVKGNFNKEMAIKGIINLVENGRKKYSREFGSRGSLIPMNGATKEACARELYDGVLDLAKFYAKQMAALKKAGKPWTMMGR